MRFVVLVSILMLVGCASGQMPEYIGRVDHPYDRQIYASFEKVTSAFIYVLKNKGWTISTEAEPSVYERDERYDNNGYQNLLITTSIRKHSHLNVFIHCLDNTCNVEIRYESQAPLVKQFTSTHNDQLVAGILDAVEQEVNR